VGTAIGVHALPSKCRMPPGRVSANTSSAAVPSIATVSVVLLFVQIVPS
jgi:hypothetical protein